MNTANLSDPMAKHYTTARHGSHQTLRVTGTEFIMLSAPRCLSFSFFLFFFTMTGIGNYKTDWFESLYRELTAKNESEPGYEKHLS